MKVMLIAVGVIVFLVVAVVAIGALLPRRHIASRSASFRTTPEQLFALIAGPQNWRSDVLRSEAVTDSSGREFMRETTRNNEAVSYELLDRKPPYSLTRRSATPNLPYSGSWIFSLQRDGDFTVVRITEDGEVYNPAFRFMSRFLFGHTHTIDAYLQALGTATGQKVEIKD